MRIDEVMTVITESSDNIVFPDKIYETEYNIVKSIMEHVIPEIEKSIPEELSIDKELIRENILNIVKDKITIVEQSISESEDLEPEKVELIFENVYPEILLELEGMRVMFSKYNDLKEKFNQLYV